MFLTTTDPAAGTTVATDIQPTSDEQLHSLLKETSAVSEWFAHTRREDRARFLEGIAHELQVRRKALVKTASSETGLGIQRLERELDRSIFQFQLFADAIREGGYLGAAIDHSAQTPLGPAPDIRRMFIPVGPVAVFGSSNFPFAFSVAGGDTASALAAGCPVVTKAHGSHPLTARASYEAIAHGIQAAAGRADVIKIVYGQPAGVSLVQQSEIRAVSFTGSLAGATVLQDAMSKRSIPAPFYGELSSINPVVITEHAAEARSEHIAAGLAASVINSGGQLCTKPGIIFIPDGPHGDALLRELGVLFNASGAEVLLNGRIAADYPKILEHLLASGAREVVHGSSSSNASKYTVVPYLLEANADQFTRDLAEECFGPLTIAVRYRDEAELNKALLTLPGSLTATIHAEDDEQAVIQTLTATFVHMAGRIVYNGYPTGVRVSWGQNHGGPWPATNTYFSSVGVSSMRRFLRPFVWQGAPQSVLPAELQGGEITVPTRIDGVLELPGQTDRE